MATNSICLKCGNPLANVTPGQPCPKCLLNLALSQTDTLGQALCDIHATVTTSPLGMLPPIKLSHGQTFGNYRIYGMLGSGGMGEVYEAEDLESGRRLALKVLGQTINSTEASKRFIREGRMAASVNHPNSVYVFGTTEIQGRPVITMELVPGGTLKDLVKNEGPLNYKKAVGAILQIIDGLEAAYEKGVLHRDVKPSNCFVDAQGDVKIGDYGLSISTLNKDDSHKAKSGTFLGTPAFASPEQLRGDDLDARSDIYAVGATLHYLLTGHAPFEETNFVRLMARVLEDAPPNLTALDPNIPRELAQVVSKCLAKSPDQRYHSYAEFRDALTPLSARSSSSPHTLQRVAAYVIDITGISVINTALLLILFDTLLPTTSLLEFLFSPLLTFTYFALSEGLTGTTISKKLFGLRVQQIDNGLSCTWRQALVRASFFILLPKLPVFILFCYNPSIYIDEDPSLLSITVLLLSIVTYLSFFITMRRSNGMATWIDLISKTRVVHAITQAKRPAAQLKANEIAHVVEGQKIGPYHVMSDLETMLEMPKAEGIRTMLGYDPQLFRKVWIRQYSSTPPDVSSTFHHITRFARLRWLSGQRPEETNGSWDAFEAPTGQPFLTAINSPMEWSQIRHLIADITQELAIADSDGTMPVTIGLDRLWVTQDGRAKILDFRAPGLSDAHAHDSWKPESASGVKTAHQLINQIAVAALHGTSTSEDGEFKLPLKPIPVHARNFLRDSAQMKTLSTLNEAAKHLLNKPAAVTRKRKSILFSVFIAVTLIPIVISLISLIYVLKEINEQNPEAYPFLSTYIQKEARIDALKSLEADNEDNESGKLSASIEKAKNEIKAYEIYGVFLIREMLKRNQETLSTSANSQLDDPIKSIFKEILSKDGNPALQDALKKLENLTTAEIDAAKLTIEQTGETLPVPKKSLIDLTKSIIELTKSLNAINPITHHEILMMFFFPIFILLSLPIFLVAAPLLFANIVLNRSPDMSLCGIKIVDENGQDPGRFRRVARTLVAWSPVILAWVFFIIMLEYQYQSAVLWIISGLLLAVFYTVMTISVFSRKRNLVDRIVGNWLTVK